MRYTDRLAEAGIVASVGSRGDSYDNVLVEFAALTWVDWFNNRRLLEPIGYVPTAEYGGRYYSDAASGVALVGIHIPTARLAGRPPSARLTSSEHCRMRYCRRS